MNAGSAWPIEIGIEGDWSPNWSLTPGEMSDGRAEIDLELTMTVVAVPEPGSCILNATARLALGSLKRLCSSVGS